MQTNTNLHASKTAKNDEFYTRLEDIEKEILQHDEYIKALENKIVLCNCDNPEQSNFYVFFKNNFNKLKLKKLITTHFNMDGGPSYKTEWSGETLNGEAINEIKTPLKGNGDFRSDECVELLKKSDIVVTNPPFSLFREFVAQLMKYKKKFIIIGNKNAITYKEFFPLLKENRVWIGYCNVHEFVQSDGTTKKFGNICWYTNIDIQKLHEPLKLVQTYKGHEERYPKYDNYDAINVDKVCDIPCDYDGVIGVPITFLDKFCHEQFEIVTFRKGNDGKDLVLTREKDIENSIKRKTEPIDYFPMSMAIGGCMNSPKYTAINGEKRYARILIRRKSE